MLRLIFGAAALLVTSSSSIACVVGQGTTASCTETALNTCLPGGGSFDGTVIFNCGGAATIPVTSTKVIGADTTIDGGGVITISGRNGVGVFATYLFTRFTVENLTIADGYSQSGAAIDSMGTLTVTNSTFSGNMAFGVGGAILVEMSSTASVTNSTFSTNAAGAEGGAIYNAGGLTVTSCTFSGNSASGGGGVILNGNSGSVTVANSSFSNNNSGMGGAIENDGTLAVTNSTFSGNGARNGGGGAILVAGGTATVTDSTFSSNTASANGGAILSGAILGDATLNVMNSTFSGNSAGSGGAVSNFAGALTVTNSTFSGNSASSDGGAISNNCSHICRTVPVTNSTFSGNSGGTGGGISNNGGMLTLTNSIVATSTSGGNCGGTMIADGGHNLDDGTTCGFTGNACANPCGTSFCNSDPKLATVLANNGGATQTLALGSMSPAINAGDETVCAAPPVDNLDQRGFLRPGAGATRCSIGAYEFDAALCGDVNGDGVVNIGDALLVAQFDVGHRQCGVAPFGHANVCDVNRDNACNIGDALRMAQCDVGLVSCTFTCESFMCP